MKRIKAGKEQFSTNWSTNCFSKLPGKAFRGLRLFFYFQVFGCVETAEFASKKVSFVLTNTRAAPLVIRECISERRNRFSN